MWAQACRQQNWTRAGGLSAAEIDVKRKELLARCGFKSLTEVDRLEGFTRVKNELLLLISDHTNLKAAAEVGDVTLNKARNLRHVIMNDLTPCLALYVADVPAYITSIMEDKNRWWKIDRPASEITLQDLDAKPVVRRVKGELKEFASTLEQLRMTLAARLNVLRNKAGDDLHTMKTRAGVPCACKACCLAHSPIVPHLALGSDSQIEAADALKQEGNENPF